MRRCCSRRMTMAVLRARPARYPVCSASVPILPIDCQTPDVERTAILLEILWNREPCVETFSSHPPAPEERGRRGSRDLPLLAVTVAGHRQRNGQNGGSLGRRYRSQTLRRPLLFALKVLGTYRFFKDAILLNVGDDKSQLTPPTTSVYSFFSIILVIVIVRYTNAR